MPQVVPDVVLSQSLQNLEEPKAATSSRSVLAGIMSTPASMRRFKVRGGWLGGGGGRGQGWGALVQPVSLHAVAKLLHR